MTRLAGIAVALVLLSTASVGQAETVGLTMSVTRPASVNAGGTFTETVSVTNPGASATGTVNVRLGGGGVDTICETAPTPICAAPPNTVLAIGSIAPGATVSATFDIKTTPDLGNGIVDATVGASDGSVFAVTDVHWVAKLDPVAQPTDLAVRYVSAATPSNSLFNQETVWQVTNLGSSPARGIVFNFNITPAPYAENFLGDVIGGTPFLLPYLEAGASDTVRVDTQTSGSTTESVTVSHNEGDSNTTNDSASTSFTPNGSAGGGSGVGSSTTPPPYQFVDQLPEITIDSFSTVGFFACVDGSQNCMSDLPTTTLIAGDLPAGMKMGTNAFFGTPYEPGTYTFTLRATYPAKNYTTIEKQFTLLVDPMRQPTSGSSSPTVVVPSRSRTPGVTNSAVTQRTIMQTVCVSGWAARIGPPAWYMNALKLRQMKQYGESGKPSSYEEDHLIPLELGGAPRNPKNLWPEPRSQSRRSDVLETALQRKVCGGRLTLAAARQQILAYKRVHG